MVDSNPAIGRISTKIYNHNQNILESKYNFLSFKDYSPCHNYVAQLFALLKKKVFIDQEASSNIFYDIMYIKTFKFVKIFMAQNISSG